MKKRTGVYISSCIYFSFSICIPSVLCSPESSAFKANADQSSSNTDPIAWNGYRNTTSFWSFAMHIVFSSKASHHRVARSSPVYVSYEHKINEKEKKEYPIIYGNRLSNPPSPKRERHRRAKLPATALSARKKIWLLLIMFRPACKRTRKGKAVEFSHTQTLAGALTALNTRNKLHLFLFTSIIWLTRFTDQIPTYTL